MHDGLFITDPVAPRWRRGRRDVLDLAGHRVRVVTPPLFVATKLEAFRGRGRGDFLGSHDLEDIVTVFDGRAELPGEIAQAPADVRDSIAVELGVLLGNRDFLDALSGFLPPDAASQRRRGAIEARLRDIVAI